MSNNLPDSVLFVCTLNSIRSPMAEGLMKHMYGDQVYVQSCGLRAGELNELMVAVMKEIGIDMQGHQAKSLQDIGDTSFDIAIAFSKEIAHALQSVFADTDTTIEIWETPDPTAGAIDVRAMMDNFRAVRTSIKNRMTRKFAKNR